MAKIKISNEWWTAPTVGATGNLILVTGRRDLDNVRDTGLYNYRVEITWKYDGDMPDDDTAKLMEEVGDALEATFAADPVAVIAGIYTGDRQRDWVVYTRSLHIFQRKLNEALKPFAVLPLQFEAYEDPEWEEYAEIRLTEINIDD